MSMYKNNNMSLLEVVTEFRCAIERTPKKQLSGQFQYFPLGSCGVVTILLGFYLFKCHFGILQYVCGTRYHGDSSASHAWLQRDQIIIDITGDQFLDRPAVYIGEADDFYKKYIASNIQEHPTYIKLPNEEYIKDYKLIISYL